MTPVYHLVLLVLALCAFAVSAAWLTGPGFTWQRAVSAGLALLAASFITW